MKVAPVILILCINIVTSYVIVPSLVPPEIVGNAQFAIGNSPYYVTTNSIVDEADSLLIDPGVLIYMFPQVSLLVRGSLTANGNSSNPIIFTGANPKYPWSNLQILSNSSQLNYCSFFNGGAVTNSIL